MAYVPPHKRLSKDDNGSSPTPEQLAPQFKNSLNLRSSRSGPGRRTNMRGQKVVNAENSIIKWLTVPLTDKGELPSSVRLIPVCVESNERKSGEKPLTLVNEHSQSDQCPIKNDDLDSPWVSVAKAIHSDLNFAFQNARNDMVDQSFEEIKPSVVARFGKVLFHSMVMAGGNNLPACHKIEHLSVACIPVEHIIDSILDLIYDMLNIGHCRFLPPNSSVSLDLLKDNAVTKSDVKDLRRMFYTNIPMSYMEHIKSGVVPKLGVTLKEEKELYLVKLRDSTRPDSTISCKCRVQGGENKLQLYKMEFNQVRHLIEDISCLDGNVDLRVALCNKRILIGLTDEEKLTVSDLISSAILDPNVKGGLRWPLGKANSGGRFSVVGVWHTKAEAYCNSNLRLKVRDADRFDFLTSSGEVTREATLKLTGITKNLLELKGDSELPLTTLEDALKLIWDNFVGWDSSIISFQE